MSKKINLYCTCGAAWMTNAYDPAKFIEAFQERHSGPGHAKCDKSTAAKARKKEREKEGRADGNQKHN